MKSCGTTHAKEGAARATGAHMGGAGSAWLTLEVSLRTSIRGDCLDLEGRRDAAGCGRPAKRGMRSCAAAQGGVGRWFKTENKSQACGAGSHGIRASHRAVAM